MRYEISGRYRPSGTTLKDLRANLDLNTTAFGFVASVSVLIPFGVSGQQASGTQLTQGIQLSPAVVHFGINFSRSAASLGSRSLRM